METATIVSNTVLFQRRGMESYGSVGCVLQLRGDAAAE